MHCFEFSFALETCCINTCCEDEANHQRNFARKPDVIGSIINVVASTEPRALVGIPMVLILLIYLLRIKTRERLKSSDIIFP
jgi:hypothetical protein